MSKYQEIPGLRKVKLGETVPAMAINRVDVADGTKGRCILLSDDWIAVSVAFTEQPTRAAYFVTRDQVLRYGLRATVYYVAVVARLNTDARGKVLDDSFKIEYLRLSENVYTEFADDALEMSNFQTVALQKVTRGQFSYLKPKASNKMVDAKLIASVRKQLKDYDINSLLKMALFSIAQPFQNYLEACKSAGIDPEPDEEPLVLSLIHI